MATSRGPFVVLAIIGMAGLLTGACGSDDKRPLRRPTLTEAGPTTTEADPVANVLDREAAKAALTAQLQLLERGEWPALWAQLYPAQQRQVDEASFTRCAVKRWGGAIDITEVHVDKIGRGEYAIPGTVERGLGFRMVVRAVGTDASGPFDSSSSYYEFKIGDAWHWVIPEPDAYKGGSCPPDDDSLH